MKFPPINLWSYPKMLNNAEKAISELALILEVEANTESIKDAVLDLLKYKDDVEQTMADESVEHGDFFDPGKHYRKYIGDLQLDPYQIALLYEMTDHMEFFILKKVLRMGEAHKDKRQELLDIINAANRRLEVLSKNAS
jgi:hypothetical protein